MLRAACRIGGACLVIVSVVLVGTRCASNGPAGGSVGGNFAGPGSDYRISLNSSAFSINELNSNLVVSGRSERMSTGFYKLTVTETNQAGTVAVGSSAYAFDVPGLLTVLKPFSGTQIITAVKAGNCPTSDQSINWVKTKLQGGDPTTEDVFGTFVYTHATTSANLGARYTLSGTDTGAQSVGAVNCADGIARPSGAVMYLTQNSGAIVNLTGGGGSFVVALPTSSVGAATNLTGAYSGLLFSGSSGAIAPVSAAVSGTTLTFSTINAETGAQSGALSGETITLADIDSPSAGFFKGTLSNGRSVRCMGNLGAGTESKKFLLCVGQDAAGGATSLMTMVLAQK